MIEDRELGIWREEWSRVAGLSPDFQRQVRQRIKLQDRRFLLGSLLTVVPFVGLLIFAGFLGRQASWLGTGWATGLCGLVIVCAGYRIWILRGTWRAETQSIHAFVELWHRRVLARLRLLRIGIYVSVGWLVYCAVLTAANWATIRPNIMAHPSDWWELLVASVFMQPVIWFGARWLRRRNLAELKEVKRLLEAIEK